MKKFNIQFFADGAEDFDLDSIMDQFEQTLTDDEPEDEPEEEIIDGEENPKDGEPTPEENPEGTPDPEEKPAPEQTPPPGNNTPQDNGRWKEMRQQAEQAQKYQAALDKLAQLNGITSDQLLAQLEDAQLATEAEQNGVSVDVQRRINDLEARNDQMDRERILGLVASDMDRMIKEHSLQGDTDPMIQNAFNYIAQNGYVDHRNLPTMRFQDAFFVANKDAIAKKQADALIQKDLEAKRQRQNATIPASNSGTSASTNVLDDAEITKSVLDDLRADGYID